MADYQYIGFGSRILKWVLVIHLLYSFFTFAGEANIVGPPQSHAVKTEWVISQNIRLKQPIPLKRAKALLAAKSLATIFPTSVNFSVIQYHSLLAKVKLTNSSAQVIYISQQWGFLRLKAVSHRSEEPFSLS